MNRRSIFPLLLIAMIAGAVVTFIGHGAPVENASSITADGRICTVCGPMP